jgi:membrane protein required for colicin V production
MNGFDVLVLVLVAAFVMLGLFRGLLRLGLSIGGLVVGLLLAIRFEDAATPHVHKFINSDLWAPMVAFVGIVVVVVVGSVIASVLLHRFLKVAHLAWVDRILGASAGLLAAIFLSAGISMVLATAGSKGPPVLKESALAPITLTVSRAIVKLAPAELKARFEEGMRQINAAS